MSRFATAAAKVPFLGRGILFFYRARIAGPIVLRSLRHFAGWLFRSKETTNFTYDITAENERHLAAMVAEVTGVAYDAAIGYMKEIEADESLREHVRKCVEASEEGFISDSATRPGRRIGWYAIVRATKPGVVVETGVDKGLGAVVLCAALLRNAAEGHPGRYYGTDINPKAGYLLSGRYAAAGRMLYGDSITSLQSLDESIDLFINDSDHSAAYEAREYETITGKLSKHAIVLGDNSHVNDELLAYSLRAGRRFLFFKEQPRDHWYPGAGIGMSFLRRS